MFVNERTVDLICDLHGHSRRKNIFMYGCDDPDDPESTRTFPYILSKVSDYFSYKSCSFRMQKSKESTLRISIFTETKVPNTYTLESTFSGCDIGPFAGLHLSIEDLKLMGRDVCMAIIINNDLHVPNTPICKNDLLTEIKNSKEFLENNEESSSGSDSDPSEDNLDAKEKAKIMASPLPKRRISSEVKKKNAKKEKVPLKKFIYKEKTVRPLPKCLNCGEFKELGHSCLKIKNIFHQSTFKSQRPMKIKDTFHKPAGFSSNSFGLHPVYLNSEGKRVRDQATQTNISLSQKKQESLSKSVYFLNTSDGNSGLSGLVRKSDCLENFVDIEKLKNIFKNEKNSLPSLSVVNNPTSEKFTKTY